MPWWSRRSGPSLESPRPLLDALQELLREDAHRFRPDTLSALQQLLSMGLDLLPAWRRMADARPAEAADLVALLRWRALPALRDYLDLPDAQKPGAAHALDVEASAWREEVERISRRMSAVLMLRLRGRAELASSRPRGSPQSPGRLGPDG